jgi:hypothetical protein
MNSKGKDVAIQSSFADLLVETAEPKQLTFVDEAPLSVVPLVYTSRKHAAVRTDEYLYSQLIPYIGNKRKLLWMIADAIRRTGVAQGTFVDFFAGSSVVARMAKTLG